MVFRLETKTVFEYLMRQGVWHHANSAIEIEPKLGKNFNLLVRLATLEAEQNLSESFLIKQEPLDQAETLGTGLQEEWNFYTVLRAHAELHSLQALVSEAVQFDEHNGILIYRFLERYRDLDEFYAQAQQFPNSIARVLGATLATIHQATFQRQEYRAQLELNSAESVDSSESADEEEVPDFRDALEYLTPDIFKRVSVDGLKFYELYQRYDSLSQAIAQLEDDYEFCCLIHNDLKFNNILLHHDWTAWEASPLPTDALGLQLSDQQGVVRLIDWEKRVWGDPALDVGAIAAEYLKVWLKSLILSRDIDIEIALRLAAVPLESLQPSLSAFLRAYLAQFPQILVAFPDFVERVLRFTGLALIESIQARLHYREPFGNVEICMLQVAKSLLCNPKTAIATVFGQLSIQPDDLAADTIQSVGLPERTAPDATPNAKAPAPVWLHAYSLDAALADALEQIYLTGSIITHPAYVPLELAYNASDRYQDLPSELRQTYLVRQVRNYIYDIYFSGEQERRFLGDDPTELSPSTPTHLKNNAVAGLDLDFYGQLQSANAGTGYLDPDWIVIKAEGDRLQIAKDGLHLWVDPAADLDEVHDPHTGGAVSLRLPNAQLVGDFYMAVGNEGEPPDGQTDIELYFNVTPDGAIALMQALTQALNQRACPFTFKVLTEPTEYERFDSAVLCIESIHYAFVRSVLQDVYPQVRSHLSDPVPLFTKRLAPGIGLAEDPEDQNDFGLSRCQLVAQALLKSPELPTRLMLLRQYFSEHGLCWQSPHLNADSSNFYPLLDTDVPSLTA